MKRADAPDASCQEVNMAVPLCVHLFNVAYQVHYNITLLTRSIPLLPCLPGPFHYYPDRPAVQ
jgi:hypothetical protein